MRMVFIDSLHLIALILKDQWYISSLQIYEHLSSSGVRFVTTYEVLTEVLAGVSRGRPEIRTEAVATAHDIIADPNITLVQPSTDLFTRGLGLYASRPDKRYSLTDCISMVVMRDMNITEVLTHDRDFENEGFVRLIK
ncbi:MAG: PIN domain-containing protein [Chloroflexi bacterium]|nr:PIN domain-containing protein [Chloroflexota bacterium]